MSALQASLIILILSLYSLTVNITFVQNDIEDLKTTIKTETGIPKAEALNQLAYKLTDSVANFYSFRGRTFSLIDRDDTELNEQDYRRLHEKDYNEEKKISLAELRLKKEKDQLEKSNEQKNELLKAAEQKYKVFRFLWLTIIILFLFTIAYFLRNKERRQAMFRKALAKDSKNELIQRMRTEHNSQIIKNNLKDKVDEYTIDKVIKDLKLSSNNTFDEDFLMIYHKVDDEFLPNLRKKHPDLTKHDQVLCGMIKIGLDSKQIAHITFRTPESIHVARSRLRNKLGMKAKEDLGLYLQDF